MNSGAPSMHKKRVYYSKLFVRFDQNIKIGLRFYCNTFLDYTKTCTFVSENFPFFGIKKLNQLFSTNKHANKNAFLLNQLPKIYMVKKYKTYVEWYNLEQSENICYSFFCPETCRI